jgi:DNA-binding transcriptional ArsR family regulator
MGTGDGADSGARGDQQADRDGLPEFIEKFAAVLITAGFPPMPARVFVALLVTDSGRLNSAELVELLRISPAAVSGAIRYLTGLGLVHKERVPGSRREYYRMPADIWRQVMTSRAQVMVRWAALLKEGIVLVGPDTQAGRRMTGHAAYFEFLATEMPALFARWDEADDSGDRIHEDEVREHHER